MKKNEELSKKFRKFFQLPSSPVAVSISDKKMDGERPKSPARFCEFVRKAAVEGKVYALGEDDLSNFTARIMLGFTEPKYVDISPRIKPAKTKSVVVAPLEKSEGKPDVVITIANPARLMEVLQVLHKTTKKRLEASCTSEGSAIAGEATALPYVEKRPNITLLCGGARTIGGYQEDELAIGVPYDTFAELAKSLAEPTLATALCGCLMDDIPDHVKGVFIDMGFDKGTDHFYGDFEGKVFRFYLNRDERGLMASATIHYPLKFKSEREAQKSVEAAKGLLAGLWGESTVLPRENWLDLILMVEFPDGLEKVALDRKKFEETISGILSGFVEVINKVAS